MQNNSTIDFEPAPVLLFAYNRPEILASTIASLKQNKLAPQTELFIFSDGPRKEVDNTKVAQVRKVIAAADGFKKVHVHLSDQNKGLAQSVIGGVSQVIAQHGSVIVLEDDLDTASNFLLYMNQCLQLYKNNPKVGSISGYTPPIKRNKQYDYDVFLYPRNCSHGWGIWKDRWDKIDWLVSDYEDFSKDAMRQKEFNRVGSDLTDMLQRQMNGTINSWAVRLSYHQYKTGTLTVYPVVSKVVNNGFGKDATNTNTYNRYHTVLDDGMKTDFKLPQAADVDVIFARRFRAFYSLSTRALGRIKTYLFWMGLIKNK